MKQWNWLALKMTIVMLIPGYDGMMAYYYGILFNVSSLVELAGIPLKVFSLSTSTCC
jgi:hypothetical protein